MGKTKKTAIQAIALTSILALLTTPTHADDRLSIGVSPGTIDFKDVLRGGYAEKRDITISTSSNTPVLCEISATGPAEKWFTYPQGTRVTLEPRTHLKLTIAVEPPNDTPNGLYQGLVYIKVIPNTTVSGTGAAIQTGVAIKYSIEVSDIEKKSYKVSNIRLEYTRGGIGYTEEKKPFNFIASLENDGNVRIKPKIKIEILSEDNTTVLETKEYSDSLLLPTTKQEIIITVPNNLPVGKYYGRYTAYLDDKIINQFNQPLEVLEKGELSISGRLEKVTLNKIWVYEDEMVEVKAHFYNDGVLSTNAQFKGKVTRINSEEGDSVVALLESEEVEVPPGKTAELITYYTPKKAGRYLISGRTRFSKRETEEKSSILNVLEAKTTTTTLPKETRQTQTALDINMVAAILLIASVLIGLLFWSYRKKKTETKEKTDEPEEEKKEE